MKFGTTHLGKQLTLEVLLYTRGVLCVQDCFDKAVCKKKSTVLKCILPDMYLNMWPYHTVDSHLFYTVFYLLGFPILSKINVMHIHCDQSNVTFTMLNDCEHQI